MDLVVCDPDTEDAHAVAAWVTDAGHEVSGVFQSASDCLARCRHMAPEAVVVGTLFRQSVDGRALEWSLVMLGIPVAVLGVGLVEPPGLLMTLGKTERLSIGRAPTLLIRGGQ